jgi:hypothetical protein
MDYLARAEQIANELRALRRRWLAIENELADALQDAAIAGARLRDLEDLTAGLPGWSRSHIHRGLFFLPADLERDTGALSRGSGWLSDLPYRGRALRLARRWNHYLESRRRTSRRWTDTDQRRYAAVQAILAAASADDGTFESAVRRLTHPGASVSRVAPAQRKPVNRSSPVTTRWVDPATFRKPGSSAT